MQFSSKSGHFIGMISLVSWRYRLNSIDRIAVKLETDVYNSGPSVCTVLGFTAFDLFTGLRTSINLRRVEPCPLPGAPVSLVPNSTHTIN